MGDLVYSRASARGTPLAPARSALDGCSACLALGIHRSAGVRSTWTGGPGREGKQFHRCVPPSHGTEVHRAATIARDQPVPWELPMPAGSVAALDAVHAKPSRSATRDAEHHQA